MGQNMVGWIRLKVSGKAGARITLRHAEVLDKTGNMYYDNLRAAKQTVEYILKGSPKEVYEPHFTFQGFRYVKVSGFPGELRKDNITGIVIHSDMEPAGEFTCSDTLLNQLQHNIQWGLRGNFVDVPTDCPQRDERLGWTGDAQVFAPTACFNYNAATFYTKWLKDLAFDQMPDGRVPHVIPDILGDGGATGWADASVMVPWTLYQQYGDLRILSDQYASMKAWIDYMKTQAGDKYLWTNGSHFGDWLAFATTRSDYPGATTDKDLIATAYFAWSTHLISKMAELLGKTEDARIYNDLFRKIREAFNREYVTPNGRLASNTQTAYALALKFGLVPDEQRQSVAKRFADDVKSFGHITTGFLGASLVNPLLSDFGYDDLAYKLLMRKEYPSWLYPVTMGATTIWERWDGIKPDGCFQDAGMNSFNHYAYGAIGSWMYSQVAGLQAGESVPAYKKIRIRPVIGGGLTHARAEHYSLFGKIASEWRIAGNRLTLYVTIPPNSSAEVFVKTTKPESVTESGKPVRDVQDVRFLRMDMGYAVYAIGSGKYTFESEN
jgi:alpha-L-rhamnosidase